MSSVTIGNEQIGDIDIDQTSSYVPIKVGETTITAVILPNTQFNTSFSVTGKGKHKWSLRLNTSGKIELTEDK